MWIGRAPLLSYFLVLVWIHFSAAGQCPGEWFRSEDSCYTIVTTKATWFEANEVCKESHSYLVEISSQREYEFMDTFIRQMKSTSDIWIGLTDLPTGKEWSWTMSQQKATFTAWAPSDPDNPNDHCVVMKKNDAHWFDRDCHNLYYFICEKSWRLGFVVG